MYEMIRRVKRSFLLRTRNSELASGYGLSTSLGNSLSWALNGPRGHSFQEAFLEGCFRVQVHKQDKNHQHIFKRGCVSYLDLRFAKALSQLEIIISYLMKRASPDYTRSSLIEFSLHAQDVKQKPRQCVAKPKLYRRWQVKCAVDGWHQQGYTNFRASSRACPKLP